MDKILSQSEVDALLRGVEAGEIQTEKVENINGVRPFDFTSQDRIIRGRMPGLEIANEKFVRMFRTTISSIIMRFVDVNVHHIKVVKFGEFMNTVPMPSSINIFKMEPLKGYALFVIETPMIFSFIEHFFGGMSSSYVKPEGRQFTPIEQRIIKKIVDAALNSLPEAWKGIVPIKAEHTGSEINPQFVTIVPPNELVVKIEIHMEIESSVGKLFFCIPYAMIEPIKEKLYSSMHIEKGDIDNRWLSTIKDILKDSYAEVSVEIGKTELTVGDLMNMEVGNVIVLNKSINDELIVKVEGVPKFKGNPGYSKGSQAVRITNII